VVVIRGHPLSRWTSQGAARPAASTASASVSYSCPEKKLTGVQTPMSSGSRRNSSKPNVPFGRAKMSTQRFPSAVWWLANTDQDLSSRDDMTVTVARLLPSAARDGAVEGIAGRLKDMRVHSPIPRSQVRLSPLEPFGGAGPRSSMPFESRDKDDSP